MADIPIACALPPDEFGARRDDLLPGLLRRSTASVETAAGFSYRFESAPDLLTAIALVLQRERDCCRFFRFVVTLEPDLGPIWLDVSGPPGTKAFLADLLA